MAITAAGYIWKVKEKCDFTTLMIEEFHWVVCLLKTRKIGIKACYLEMIDDLKEVRAREYLKYTTYDLREDISKVNSFIDKYNKRNQTNYTIEDLEIEEC